MMEKGVRRRSRKLVVGLGVVVLILIFILCGLPIAEAADPPPSITLLSQTPSTIYANSTGPFNVTWEISYNGTVGLNNSSIAFMYTVQDLGTKSRNHSIGVPSNNKSAFCHAVGEYILRADNRNESRNFEDNDTITGGNIYEWGGADENAIRMTIVSVDANTTRVHWNGTMHDTVFSEMWYLDRTEIESVEKTKYPIDISHSLIAKIWDIGAIEGFDEYLISLYVDTAVRSPPPKKNIEIYYLNASFDPNGSIAPEDSPYGFYLTSHDATTWVNHTYTPRNTSYICAGRMNRTAIKDAGITVTNTGWLYFKSNTLSAKPYYINVTNATTSTNRTFGETNVTYIGASASFEE